MKHNILQFNAKDFHFIITPIAIKTNKSIQGIYTLQLEKGCQHIANLDESIRFGINQTYFFTNKVGITVKTFKQNCMNISWSLYKSTKNKLLEFIDIFTVNLQGYYLQYIQELKKHHRQYSNICQNKANKLILEQNWKRLKTILKHNKFQLELKSSQGSFILDCSLQIKHQFDNITYSQTQKKGLIRKESSRKSLIKQPSNTKINQINKNDNSKQISNPSFISQGKKEEQIKVQIKINGASHPKDYLKQETNEQFPNASSMAKRYTVLSDIIEASVEQSRLYTTERTQKIAPNQPFLTISEDQQIKFIKTSTFHFQNQQNDQTITLKRINSLESPKRKHKIQDQVEKQEKYVIDETDVEQSKVKTSKQQQIQLTNSQKYYLTKKLKYIILIILFFACFLFAFHNKIFPQKIIKNDSSKKRKQKSNKFNVL